MSEPEGRGVAWTEERGSLRLSDEAEAVGGVGWSGQAQRRPERPAGERASTGAPLMVVGHGTRDPDGVAEFGKLVERLRGRLPAEVAGGFIELSPPPLTEAVAELYGRGHRRVAAVPLVLVAAGHGKGDIPGALARERHRHPGLSYAYGRPLGPHPTLLSLLAERLDAALDPADRAGATVLLVGRGSTDPDANAEVHKVARLLWEGAGAGSPGARNERGGERDQQAGAGSPGARNERGGERDQQAGAGSPGARNERGGERDQQAGLAGVETAFVSLARPGVPEGLERCRRLGARRIVVLPYFLFPGVLPDRVAAQARGYAAAHPALDIRAAEVIGDCDGLADVVLERYEEALAGDIRMNCDTCVYRIAMPGFEDRVGAAQHPHHHPHDP